MKTNVADTSLATYDSHRVNFGAQEIEVLSYLKRVGEPVTINEVAKALGFVPGTASARMDGLRRKGVVTDSSPKRKCKVCGATCKTFRLTTEADRVQASLFGTRRAS